MSTKKFRNLVGGQKLRGKYMGPYKVVRCINPVTVELKLAKTLRHIYPVFHFSLLPVALRPEKPVPLAIIADGKEHHKMAEILDSKIKCNIFLFNPMEGLS